MKDFIAFIVFVAVIGCLLFGVGKMTLGDEGPVTHTTINRAPLMEAEEQDSGDSELAHVKFVNAVDRFTGWSDLSMDEQAVRVKLAGMTLEAVGKAMPKHPITGGFWHSFFRHAGTQMQIQAMYHLDELSPNPAISAVQGFLVGL
jgi:hypothetical protein